MLGCLALIRKHQSTLLLFGVLAVAAGLIFFRLDRADLQTDGAVYSLRALGYLDYLNTPLQSAPLQWYASPPWWTRLSFHDAPPLVFLIQFFFFSVLGESTLVARIPGAFAGVGSVILVGLIGRRLWGNAAGQLAALLISTSALFVSAAREPYLESVEVFFILLSVWVFTRAVREPRWWPAWGIAAGLALDTKYTAFFVVPAAVGYLVAFQRPALRQRQFWLGVGLLALTLSPALIYNTGLYFSRGHLDLQLSRLVPGTWEAAKAAWPKLYAEVGTAPDFLGNAKSMVTYVGSVVTLPELLLGLTGIGWLTFVVVRRKLTPPLAFIPWLSVVLLAAFFTLQGPAPRFLPVLSPWIALASAGALVSFWRRWRALMPRWGKAMAAAGLVFLLGYALLFTVNTNHSFQPVGSPWWYSPTLRLGNDGFQQLAGYLEPRFSAQPGYTFHRPRRRDQILSDFTRLAGQDLFIYQADLRWFSAFWYFQRYSLYHDVYVLSDRELAAVAESEGRPLQMPQFFQAFGARRVYFIVGVAPGGFESGFTKPSALTQSLEQVFVANLNRGARGESVAIKNPTGQVGFRVYALDMNQ